MLFLDAQQPHDHGAEDEVEAKLKEEVSARKTKEGVSGGVFEACCGSPSGHRFPEKQAASNKENACVDDGAEEGGTDHGSVAIQPLDQLVDQRSGKPAAQALQQDRQDRAGGVDGKKCCGITAEQHDRTEGEAKPSGDHGATGRGADDDGDQHKGYREGAEADEGAKQLKHHNHSGQQRAKGHGLRGDALSRVQGGAPIGSCRLGRWGRLSVEDGLGFLVVVFHKTLLSGTLPRAVASPR